eukprot:scaffold266_cov391-Prasinococcus_capsulatus_cf.AAC.17
MVQKLLLGNRSPCIGSPAAAAPGSSTARPTTYPRAEPDRVGSLRQRPDCVSSRPVLGRSSRLSRVRAPQLRARGSLPPHLGCQPLALRRSSARCSNPSAKPSSRTWNVPRMSCRAHLHVVRHASPTGSPHLQVEAHRKACVSLGDLIVGMWPDEQQAPYKHCVAQASGACAGCITSEAVTLAQCRKRCISGELSM